MPACSSKDDKDDVGDFLSWYWERPLPSQGEIPPAIYQQTISLQPDSCNSCHAVQFNDWRASQHAHAMGPGLMGQLVTMAAHATDDHQACIRCHAPLAEQAESLSAAIVNDPPATLKKSPTLHEQGLICAACHVRGYRWYGPPRRDGSQASGDTSQWPHQAWTSSAAFEDSRFCAACHQFKPDEFSLNGKLIENTYEEWKASRYARDGKTCQSCHMPERKHMWRGIHDPEMVKQGLTIDTTPPRISSNRVSSTLTIKNTGVGHFFPTYVTPKVIIEGYQEDASGNAIQGSTQTLVIGRQVAIDLSQEIADTRLPPDGEAKLVYRVAMHPNAVALVFQIRVEPDAFYTQFYKTVLEGKTAGKGESLIRQALAESEASTFMLYRKHYSLPL